MENTQQTPIRTQIFMVNLIVIGVTIVLTLFGTLYITLNENHKNP